MEVIELNAAAVRAVLKLAEAVTRLSIARARSCEGDGKQEATSAMQLYMRSMVLAHIHWYHDGNKLMVIQRIDDIANAAIIIGSDFHTVSATLEGLKRIVAPAYHVTFYDNIAHEARAARAAALRDLAFYKSTA